jgi:glycosyltransferase involved in cell wall biosynthesis
LISVVIGTDNSERILVPTLTALVPAAAAGIVREVIVTDHGSTDATAEVADMAGCEIMVSEAPLADRLREAAGRARAPWLLFLKPGVVLDAGWIEETSRFIEFAELNGSAQQRAAVFRRASAIVESRPVLFEALALLKSALGARPHPEQALLIFKPLYDQLGGHRADALDPEVDFLVRLGRKRLVTLRSGAMKMARE